jgi:hypothetical protein
LINAEVKTNVYLYTQTQTQTKFTHINLMIKISCWQNVDLPKHAKPWMGQPAAGRGGKGRPERETDNSLPSNAKVKKRWSYTSSCPFSHSGSKTNYGITDIFATVMLIMKPNSVLLLMFLVQHNT